MQNSDIAKWVGDFIKTQSDTEFDLKPDTDLFEEGHLDSMSIIQLIAELESKSGQTLDLSALAYDNFRTVRTIENTIKEQSN